MDPLSMTASIIAVLQLTTTLTSYISDARGANKEQAQFAVEASNLFSLLTSLRFRVEAAQGDDPWFRQVRNLGVTGGPLEQLRSILEEMVKSLSNTKKRDHIRSTLFWPFTKPEIERALNRIERLKTYINSALANDHFALSQSIHSEIVASRREWRSHTDKELLKRISDWLSAPDPSGNYHAALEKRHPDTGLWLVNGSQFEEWRKGPSALMCLHGNAGCGKTVLSAAALHKLFQEVEYGSNHMVAYFYFDFNDTEKQSSAKAVRSIILQLATQDDDNGQMVEQLYRRYGSGQQQPAGSVLRALLQEMLAIPRRKYVVLDALDECTDEELLPLIAEMVQPKHAASYILATSRREKNIEDRLTPIAAYNLDVKSAVVDEDIQMYVKARLQADPRLRKWPLSDQQKISTALTEKADGMFRWVFCQLESLRRCVKPRELQKALESLPKTLDETYERILKNLESDEYIEDAIKVLQWLCFSKRPMNLLELREALAIENGEDGGFFVDNRLPDPTDIKLICSSLVVVDESDFSNRAEDPSYSSQPVTLGVASTIRLAHFSVKEYLLSDRCIFQQNFTSRSCHKLLAEACLRYLLYKGEQATSPPTNRTDLCCYAADYWWKHARSAESELSGSIFDLTLQVFRNYGTLLPFLELHDSAHNTMVFEKRYSSVLELKGPPTTPLYYAAFIGLHELVSSPLFESVDVNAQGGPLGNALQAAVQQGHEQVVQVLLDKGAEVNTSGDEFETPLRVASARGYESIVRMLLDKGAKVNAWGGMYGTALRAASGRGHESIVRMLLDKGAEVNAGGGVHGTPLLAASSHGYEGIVRMLLDKGAKVNFESGFDGTALLAASARGYEPIVRMLLDKGAEVNFEGGMFGTALLAASQYGYESIVRMLLDKGADVESPLRLKARLVKYTGTPLTAASQAGHKQVVQLLIDNGADINAQDENGETPLLAASGRGQVQIVKMLLDRGAKGDTMDYRSNAP